MHSHIYLPNAFLLDEETIRIIAAFWDEKRVGRVGYIDTKVKDPLKIAGFSEKPSLDIGIPGTFDDNGVTPLCVVTHQDRLRLYYAGWQLSDKVRYFLFTGLAESADTGITFHRVQQTPILERRDGELMVRTGGFTFRDGGHWSMIYSGGSDSVIINNLRVPSYDLRLIHSADGIDWPGSGALIFKPDRARGEFGFGRPFILKEKGIWKMWYGIRMEKTGYRIGYAESGDGKNWQRMDERMDDFNNDGWPYDTKMRAFPSLLATPAGTFLFYNGNDHGKEGVCVARLRG